MINIYQDFLEKKTHVHKGYGLTEGVKKQRRGKKRKEI